MSSHRNVSFSLNVGTELLGLISPQSDPFVFLALQKNARAKLPLIQPERMAALQAKG